MFSVLPLQSAAYNSFVIRQSAAACNKKNKAKEKLLNEKQKKAIKSVKKSVPIDL